MRVLNGFFALALLGFAVVQYNDPDAVFWGVVYGVGAAWALAATLVPRALRRRPVALLLSLTIAAALLGVIRFWPDQPNWWRMEVWWEAEGVREGMGLMILAIALIAAGVTAVRAGKSRPAGKLVA